MSDIRKRVDGLKERIEAGIGRSAVTSTVTASEAFSALYELAQLAEFADDSFVPEQIRIGDSQYGYTYRIYAPLQSNPLDRNLWGLENVQARSFEEAAEIARDEGLLDHVRDDGLFIVANWSGPKAGSRVFRLGTAPEPIREIEEVR